MCMYGAITAEQIAGTKFRAAWAVNDFLKTCGVSDGIPDFNDHPDRTKAECVAVLYDTSDAIETGAL